MKRVIQFCLLLLSAVIATAQQPELVLPIGHTDIVRTARFSPDDKYVLTGGADKVVHVWETFSGKKVRSLGGNISDISYAFFSNDSKYIAVGTDSTVNIWSLPSYTLMGTFNLVRGAVFSPDSKKLFLPGYDGNVKQVSLPSLITEYEYADNVLYGGKNRDLISNVTVSMNSRIICNAGIDSVVTTRDIQTGKIIARKSVNEIPQLCFFTNNDSHLVVVTRRGIQKLAIKNGFTDSILSTSEVESAHLSGNNRFLLTSSDYIRGKAVLWDFDIQKPVFTSDTVRSKEDTFMVIDSNDKAEIKTGTAAFSFPGLISSRGAVIANDGKYISIPDLLWNCMDNSRSYQVRDNYLRRGGISSDSRHLLVRLVDDEETVFLWDIQEKKIIQSYRARADKIRIGAISPDGKKMLAAGDFNTMKIFDLTTGKISQVLKHHDKISYGAFSKDGTRVLTNSFDSTAKLWDVATGVLLQNYPGQHPDFSPAYFSNDGQLVLSPVNTDTIPVYDDDLTVTRYDVIMRHYIQAETMNAPNRRSNSGRYRLFSNYYTGELILSDSLREHTTSLGDGNEMNAFSPDEKLLVLSDRTKMDTLIIWDIESGKRISYLGVSVNSAGFTGRRGFTQLLFTPDNKYLLAADGNAVIHGFTTKDFKEVFSLRGQRFSISNDSKRIVVINEGKAEVVDFEKRQVLFSYIFTDSLNYLVFDPQKRFDGTALARKLLYYACGNEIIDLDQAKDQLWVPNLVERIMRGDPINAKTLDQLNICGLTPEVKDASKPDEYYFKILPRRGGLGETVLYLNGIEARRYKPEQLKRNGETYELTIKKADLNNYFIAGKENPVIVKAYTSDNNISSRGVIITEDKTKELITPPDLYAVMVGVSDYKGEELDLKYAAKDANDISAAISNAAKKLLNRSEAEHVFMYNLTTAQERYQLPEKNSIKKILEEIGKKARANDILLIFFSGHGVMEEKSRQFYFLTADASTASATESVKEVGISTAELAEWMKPENIKAQKRILIFDACNSGQAIRDFVQLGNDKQQYVAARNDDKSQQIKAIDKLNEKSGLFILSASASSQNAYEMGRYSQGLLTYSLLKAIKQQPDILEEGKYLNLSRWFNAAEKTVSELSKESGARQEPQIIANTNFNIGIVDNEVMAKIVLPLEKPLFAASNFQNSDEAADGDNLELSKLINLQLNETAARGTDSRIVYVTATNSPDAFTLSGRYDVSGNIISIRVSLKKNNETQYRFEEKGARDALKELAANLVNKATAWVTANK